MIFDGFVALMLEALTQCSSCLLPAGSCRGAFGSLPLLPLFLLLPTPKRAPNSLYLQILQEQGYQVQQAKAGTTSLPTRYQVQERGPSATHYRSQHSRQRSDKYHQHGPPPTTPLGRSSFVVVVFFFLLLFGSRSSLSLRSCSSLAVKLLILILIAIAIVITTILSQPLPSSSLDDVVTSWFTVPHSLAAGRCQNRLHSHHLRS